VIVLDFIKKIIKKIFGAYHRRLEGMYTHPFYGNPPIYSGAVAFAILMVVEGCGYGHVLGGFMFLRQNPYAFLLNFLIIYATLSVGWIFRRRWFANSMLMTVWIVLGIVNGIVLSTRMTPFTVNDFENMNLGMEVYLTDFQIGLVILAGVMGGLIFLLFFLKAPRRPPWKGKKEFFKWLAAVGLVFVMLGSCWFVGNKTGLVASYFTNLWDAYEQYGMPYGFLSTWFRKGIDRPSDYSEAAVDAVFSGGELDTMTTDEDPDKTAEDFPNIVFLQLESFMDPHDVESLSFSEDPVPYFRELKDKYSSGHLTVPVVGGGTANTEFEAITGMSCREFGPGEYPYKSVLKKKTVESMAYDLRELGYTAHAIHNHRGAFYDRNKVFANLGFDDFTSIEYMNYVTKTQRGYAKDDVLTGEILGALESTEGHDYIYTISVQGHGEYPKKPLIKDPVIRVEGTSGSEQDAGWEFYLEQIHEMDEFLRVLTEELESFDEDVVLVMYGDHLPALDITDDGVKSGSTFNTEYVIWSNFPMKQDDRDLSAYQLGAVVQEQVGLRQGVMTVFHQDKMGTKGYADDLHMLQYDILYGKDYIYGGSNPYKATDMKMGYKPIRVKEIVEVAGEYFISGEGFTPFSKVSLNGEVLDTVYVGPTVLKLEEEVDPDSVKDMKVSQVEKYKEVLSTTE
jgi:phosphoglycerol transferase MdoB-like AlkP superfamily enzyme